MDYPQLAAELMQKMQELRKTKHQRQFSDSLHGEAFVLDYVAFSGGDVLPGEISNEMEVSSARIAAALNRLEAKGLITRRIDKSDRRKILVGTTDEGKVLAEKHRQSMLGEVARMLTLLGEDDAKEYVRIMGRLVEVFPKCKEPL